MNVEPTVRGGTPILVDSKSLSVIREMDGDSPSWRWFDGQMQELGKGGRPGVLQVDGMTWLILTPNYTFKYVLSEHMAIVYDGERKPGVQAPKPPEPPSFFVHPSVILSIGLLAGWLISELSPWMMSK